MDVIKERLEAFILDPRYSEVLALVKAARNGVVYGAKVRFPHALVVWEKMRTILKATRTHARNLATFAFLYKASMLALKSVPRPLSQSGKEVNSDAFLAGLFSGYLVFGRGIQSSVNQQIVIYVFGRVMLALARLLVHETNLLPADLRDPVTRRTWPVFASLSWAMVMWLFRWHPDTLQPSLRSSMKYLYNNADHWDGLRTFLWHNS